MEVWYVFYEVMKWNKSVKTASILNSIMSDINIGTAYRPAGIVFIPGLSCDSPVPLPVSILKFARKNPDSTGLSEDRKRRSSLPVFLF